MRHYVLMAVCGILLCVVYKKNILVNKPVQSDCMNGPCGLIEWYTVQTDYIGSLYKCIAWMACTE